MTQATKPVPTKAATVLKLLRRPKGATLDQLANATGWKPHSCRAHLTGLKKKGEVVTRQTEGARTFYRAGPQA